MFTATFNGGQSSSKLGYFVSCFLTPAWNLLDRKSLKLLSFTPEVSSITVVSNSSAILLSEYSLAWIQLRHNVFRTNSFHSNSIHQLASYPYPLAKKQVRFITVSLETFYGSVYIWERLNQCSTLEIITNILLLFRSHNRMDKVCPLLLFMYLSKKYFTIRIVYFTPVNFDSKQMYTIFFTFNQRWILTVFTGTV